MIRPIDMQMLLPQSESVGNIQHHENQRGMVEHMQTTAYVQKEDKKNSESVIQKDATDLLEYRYDAKEKGNSQYQDNSKKKKEKKDSTPEQKKSEITRVNFDIRV